jgi:hypothetical protein
MTDRELLEMAAKAAGWASWDWLAGDEFLNVYDADGVHEMFNPLTDDGDALRLAVKLRLDICRLHEKHEAVCVWLDHAGDFIEEPHGSDPYAATRRAIVRAAAEIGKAMP